MRQPTDCLVFVARHRRDIKLRQYPRLNRVSTATSTVASTATSTPSEVTDGIRAAAAGLSSNSGAPKDQDTRASSGPGKFKSFIPLSSNAPKDQDTPIKVRPRDTEEAARGLADVIAKPDVIGGGADTSPATSTATSTKSTDTSTATLKATSASGLADVIAKPKVTVDVIGGGADTSPATSTATSTTSTETSTDTSTATPTLTAEASSKATVRGATISPTDDGAEAQQRAPVRSTVPIRRKVLILNWAPKVGDLLRDVAETTKVSAWIVDFHAHAIMASNGFQWLPMASVPI